MYLSNNAFGNDGAKCLAKALETYQPLTVLCMNFNFIRIALEGNYIANDGARMISAALKIKKNLIYLYIRIYELMMPLVQNAYISADLKAELQAEPWVKPTMYELLHNYMTVHPPSQGPKS